MTPNAMKTRLQHRFYLIIGVVCVLMGMGLEANATTYYGKNSAAPNALGSWGINSGGGGANPGSFTNAGDVFTIESGTTMTASAAWLIGAAGTTASQLTINSGGSLVMNTSLLTLASCNFTNGGSFTSTTGGVTISGTLATNSIGGFSTTGPVTCTKTAGTATFQNNVSAGSITVSGSGGTLCLGTTTLAYTITVSGTVTLTAGTLCGANGSSLTGTINIGGNLIINGGNFVTYPTNVYISGYLQIDYGATFDMGGWDGMTPAFSVAGNTTVSGTFDCHHGYKTFAGDVLINTTGILKKTDVLNFGGAFYGNLTNNGTCDFTPNTGTFTFYGSSKAINGPNEILLSNTAFQAGSSYQNNGILTIQGNLSGSGPSGGGYLTQGANSILKITGTPSYSHLDATTHTPNTVNFAGASQNVININYSNLTLSGSGIDVLQTGITSIGGNFTLGGTVTTSAVAGLSIGGDVTLGSGTSFTAGSFTHNIAGNWYNNGSTFTNTGSTITFNGTGAKAIGGSSSNTFNNLTITNTGGTCTAGSALTVGGTLTTNTSTILDMGTNALSVSTVAHSGTLKTQNTAATPISTGVTWGGTVIYNGAAQTVSTGSYTNLTLAGTGTKTIGTGASGTLTTGTFNIDHSSGGTATASVTNTNVIAQNLKFTGNLQAAGTWGSTSSTATNSDNSNFTAGVTGYL